MLRLFSRCFCFPQYFCVGRINNSAAFAQRGIFFYVINIKPDQTTHTVFHASRRGRWVGIIGDAFEVFKQEPFVGMALRIQCFDLLDVLNDDQPEVPEIDLAHDLYLPQCQQRWRIDIVEMVSSLAGLVTCFVSCSACTIDGEEMSMLRITSLIIFYLVSLPVFAVDRTLLILGDSLSAGYGIPVEQGWVHLLDQRLVDAGYTCTIVNASVSGETTLGAKVRLETLMQSIKPDITIVELGGNDGLRGLSTEAMHDNLLSIIEQLMAAGSKVLLIPMQLPPNYGQVYNEKVGSIYRQLADQEGVTLGKFILAGISDKPNLMQDDGIHPVAKAQGMILENIWPDLEPLLNR